jgi:hypothetical protein
MAIPNDLNVDAGLVIAALKSRVADLAAEASIMESAWRQTQQELADTQFALTQVNAELSELKSREDPQPVKKTPVRSNAN